MALAALSGGLGHLWSGSVSPGSNPGVPFLTGLDQTPLSSSNGNGWESGAPSCPANAPISCRNTSVVEDLCCFNAPGGQMLQTQFWDVSPPTGPADAWTIHGLWPDLCDGSYEANCDSTRYYTNISSILTSFNATSLLSTMQTYWKDYHGADQSLWYHEWNKHGTCVSTLSPSCYGSDYTPQEEVVDYFATAVSLYKSLDTFVWLSSAGIVPSTTQTYSKADIQRVLSAKHGMPVTLGCHSGVLNEVWYHFDVRGSVATGQFIPTEPLGGKNTCPATGIRYPPKGSSGVKPTTTARGGHPAPTSVPGVPFTGKGFLSVETDDGESTGCIIGEGTWYASGSCATFTATPVETSSSSSSSVFSEGESFTLASRKGYCAIVKDGAFKCAASIREPTVFGTSEDGKLSHEGSDMFFADGKPRGWKKVEVFVGDDGGRHGLGLGIQWQSL